MYADLLIENALVVTMDPERRVIENGSVAVAGGKIAAVGPAGQVRCEGARRVLDGRGHILLPGFVDCLGYAGWKTGGVQDADRPLATFAAAAQALEGQGEGFWPGEGETDARQSLYFGVTTAHRLLPKGQETAALAMLAAARGQGLDLRLSLTPDLNAPGPAFEAGVRRCLTALEKEPRLGLCVYPFGRDALFVRPCTSERPPANLAQRGARVQRLLEMLPQRRLATGWFLGGELAALADMAPALAKRPLLVAGMYGASLGEIQLMQQAGHSFAHAPQTWQPGCRFIEMLFRGLRCGITPAGFGGREPYDPLLAARRAMLEEITRADDYHYLPGGKVLELLTIDAAAALGLESTCGSIETGKRADINMIHWRTPQLAPCFMPVQTVVMRATGQNIGTVVAAGHIVKENGRLTCEAKEAG